MEGYSEPTGSQQQTSGTPTVLGADGDTPHLEGKVVAHYHAGPLGATTVVGTKLNLRDPRRGSGRVSGGHGSRVEIGGPQSPKSNCLVFEVDLI